MASVSITAAGQSLPPSGSKSTQAPATGCKPSLLICRTTPDTVRNPPGDDSGVPVSAERETFPLTGSFAGDVSRRQAADQGKKQ